MSSRSIQYIVFLFFPLFLSLIVSLIMYNFAKQYLSDFWPFFLSFSSLIHIAAGLIVLTSEQRDDPDQAKKKLMANLVVTVSRLLLSLIIFLIYVLLSNENHMLGAIYFVSIYFLFLLFDVLSKSIFVSTHRKK